MLLDAEPRRRGERRGEDKRGSNAETAEVCGFSAGPARSRKRCSISGCPLRRGPRSLEGCFLTRSRGDAEKAAEKTREVRTRRQRRFVALARGLRGLGSAVALAGVLDRKSTRLNSSHRCISY